METRIADQSTTYSYTIRPLGTKSHLCHGTPDQYRRDVSRLSIAHGRGATISRLHTIVGGYPVLLPEDSEKLVRDAYGIAWIGACNVRAVASTIEEWLRQGVPASNVFIRCMMAHVDYLNGKGLGPEFSDLDTLRDAFAAL